MIDYDRPPRISLFKRGHFRPVVHFTFFCRISLLFIVLEIHYIINSANAQAAALDAGRLFVYDALANKQEVHVVTAHVFHLVNRNNRNTHYVIARTGEDAYRKLANALNMETGQVKSRYRIGISAPLKDVLERVKKAVEEPHFYPSAK